MVSFTKLRFQPGHFHRWYGITNISLFWPRMVQTSQMIRLQVHLRSKNTCCFVASLWKWAFVCVITHTYILYIHTNYIHRNYNYFNNLSILSFSVVAERHENRILFVDFIVEDIMSHRSKTKNCINNIIYKQINMYSCPIIISHKNINHPVIKSKNQNICPSY